MIVRNEKETDHRHVEELIRKAFLQPLCARLHRALSGAGHARPRGLYSGAGPGAGTGRPGDRQHSVHKGEAFRRGGEGKRDPHVRPVCIAPEYQRMGYGRRLMERLLKRRLRWAMTLLLFSAVRRTMWPEALKAAKSSTSARITDVTPRPCW